MLFDLYKNARYIGDVFSLQLICLPRAVAKTKFYYGAKETLEKYETETFFTYFRLSCWGCRHYLEFFSSHQVLSEENCLEQQDLF